MNRWRLAVAGTAAVGATVVVAWILLLPYTLGQPTKSPLLDSIRQRWAESRVAAPVAKPLPLAAVRAEAARQVSHRLAGDPSGRFALLVPVGWRDLAMATGSSAFAVGSTTVSFSYPAAVTEALPGAVVDSVAMDGRTAVRSRGDDRVQVVAQLPGGYAVLSAAGPDAAALSDALLPGVYLNE